MARLTRTLLMIFASIAVFLQGCGHADFKSTSTTSTTSKTITTSTTTPTASPPAELQSVGECKASNVPLADMKTCEQEGERCLTNDGAECAGEADSCVCKEGVARGGECKASDTALTEIKACAKKEQDCLNADDEDCAAEADECICRDNDDPRLKEHQEQERYTKQCNESLAHDMSFEKDSPITTLDECEDLAEELRTRFRRHDSVDYAHSWPTRCYMEGDAFFFQPTNRTPSTVACRKYVQTMCKTCNDQCSGQVGHEIEMADLYWTPFVEFEDASDSMKNRLFMRRTCKTEQCIDRSDQNWCCDIKRGTRSAEEYDMTDEHFSYLAKGYRKTESKVTGGVVFLDRRNGVYLNGYGKRLTEWCDSSTSVLDFSSTEQHDSTTTSEDEHSSGYHVGASVDAWFVSISVEHESSEVRSETESTFINESVSKNEVIVQSKTDCHAKELTNALLARPLFTVEFLYWLGEVQDAMREDENEQTRVFRKFVKLFGTHIIHTAQFGGSYRILQRTTSKEKARDLEHEYSKCDETQTSDDAEVGAYGSSVSGGVSSGKKHCKDNVGASSSSSSEDTSNQHVESLGHCECESGEGQPAGEKDVLVNVKLKPIWSCFKQEWFTQSAWFGIYQHHDTDIIKQFFTRWLGLEFGKDTCFISDHKRFNKTQDARRGCHDKADPSSCQLEMCASTGRETNIARINSLCQGTKCDNLCCLPIPLGKECATRDQELYPHPCADNGRCVRRTRAMESCSKSDSSGCICQAPYIDAGNGLCVTKNNQPVTHYQQINLGSSLSGEARIRHSEDGRKKECIIDGMCRGLSVNKWGNCLLYNATADFHGGGELWGPDFTRCWVKLLGLEGEECWTQCNKSSGPCNFCGSGNKCCRKNWNGGEKGCRTDEGTENHHVCVTRSGSTQ